MDDVKPNKKTTPSVVDREARWRTARMVFETTELSMLDIAGLMGVRPGTVRTHIKDEGWTKRCIAHAPHVQAAEQPTSESGSGLTADITPAVSLAPVHDRTAADASRTVAGERREDVVSRLHSAIALQVDDLEARFKTHGSDGIERDVKTLGVLAKTVETLMLIDQRRTNSAAAQDSEVDLERARAEIAQRLERLRAAR